MGIWGDRERRARYEHKTIEEGASYDTNYKVLIRCAPDCPACAFKKGASYDTNYGVK